MTGASHTIDWLSPMPEKLVVISGRPPIQMNGGEVRREDDIGRWRRDARPGTAKDFPQLGRLGGLAAQTGRRVALIASSARLRAINAASAGGSVRSCAAVACAFFR